MPLKLLLFDMDGTLVCYPEGSFHSSWDALGFAAGKKEEWLEKLAYYYPRPELYEEWLQENCKLLKGVSAEQTLSRILPPPYPPGLKEFFQYLNQKQEKPLSGLVTSGVDLIAAYLQQDFSLKNNVPLWKKGEIVQEIMEKYQVPPENTAFFGDYENDIPAWQVVGFPLAVNLKKNKPEVREKCLSYVKHSFDNFYQAWEFIKELKKRE